MGQRRLDRTADAALDTSGHAKDPTVTARLVHTQCWRYFMRSGHWVDIDDTSLWCPLVSVHVATPVIMPLTNVAEHLSMKTRQGGHRLEWPLLPVCGHRSLSRTVRELITFVCKQWFAHPWRTGTIVYFGRMWSLRRTAFFTYALVTWEDEEDACCFPTFMYLTISVYNEIIMQALDDIPYIRVGGYNVYLILYKRLSFETRKKISMQCYIDVILIIWMRIMVSDKKIRTVLRSNGIVALEKKAQNITDRKNKVQSNSHCTKQEKKAYVWAESRDKQNVGKS